MPGSNFRRNDSLMIGNKHANNHLPLNQRLLVTSGAPPHIHHHTTTHVDEELNGSSSLSGSSSLGRGSEFDDGEDYINIHEEGLGRMEGGLQRSVSTTSLNSVISRFDNTIPRETYNGDIIKFVKLVFVLVLFCAILVTATLSKVTFVAIASKLFDATANISNFTTPKDDVGFQSVTFIQLVLVLMVPQLVTVVRMFFAGIVGKSQKNYPWPSPGAIVAGVVVSLLESAALTSFALLVATHLDPAKTILLTPGIFFMTALLGMCCCCRSLKPPDRERVTKSSACNRCCTWVMNSAFVNFFAVILQLGGTAAAAFLIFYSYEVRFDRWVEIDYLSHPWNYALRISLTILVTGPLLSLLWSRLVQGFIFRFKYDVRHSNLGRLEGRPGLPASRRGGFLYAGVRLVAIPFTAYGFMRILHIEPDIVLGFSGWTGLDIAVVVVQILSSLLTFILGLIALWATVQRWAFTLPLLLSTPLAVGWYWLSQVEALDVFPFYKRTPYFFDFNKNFDGLVLAVLAALWVGQVLALGAYIWKKPRYALAREQSLFLSPHYDSIFVDSFMLLNRLSVQSMYWHPISNFKSHSRSTSGRQPAVFICSTMYREAEHEMRQMLTSINRVAEAISDGRKHTSVKKRKEPPHYESHIFFDGATSGNKFNEFVLQLISLLEETLGLDLSDIEKTQTPYGYQLKWMVKDVLPIFVHLKDNSKVKNKKRWSQVMYMSYIIDHRLQERDGEGRERFDPHTTYILTTDADIDFKAESVGALLDFLYRDDSVGAVCARTHPLGSGPLVWYQIFEYAFGHWFQKSAEHVLGCVLCCPGCFSVFRVSAIADVLDTYQSSVTTASEFLTKDMGEDRWLCTLLIEKGWRLEYAALSQNSTFCPDNFNEFFSQRRRWVPSTVANLMELMANAKSIAFNNDSISFIFILYQLIIIFSTAITPGTVILVVASGLQSAYEWNTYAIVGVLGAISILYGIVCLVFEEKVQLNVGKALTVAFSIVMAISFTGIVTQTISFLELQTLGNTTSGEVAGYITIDSVYLWGFSAIVIIAGLLHISELANLLHFAWYILALPSAYLLLMIYSAANLNNRSWGTRVGISARQASTDDNVFGKIKTTVMGYVSAILGKAKDLRLSRKKNDGEEEMKKADNENIQTPPKEPEKPITTSPPSVPLKISHPPIQEDVKQWLSRLQCEEYASNFESHGYTRFEFIWGMKIEDLQDIGITKRGHLLRLSKAICKQVPPLFQSGLPTDVGEFLESIELTQYLPIFKTEGYYLPDDVENLIGLTVHDLKEMGITKKAHLKVISGGISRLRNPTGREVKIHNTKAVVEKAPTFQLRRTDMVEDRFWTTMAEGVLKPELSVANNDTDELKEKLKGLRNNTVVAMLVINVLWLALLLSFNLQYLERFGIIQSALPALFAVLYFGILAVQFVCLIVHRIETMVHVLART